MKKRNIFLFLCLLFLIVAIFFNWKYEVIAVHPFKSEGKHELKVMTWNVHCSNGVDSVRQRKLSEFIYYIDADFILLNEYYQDSCVVMDSLLKIKYQFTEEFQSHRTCGDVFYSKRMMSCSGQLKIPKNKGEIRPIKAIITEGGDSVLIFGVHFTSNHYDGTTWEKKIGIDTTSYNRYKEAQKKRSSQAHWIKEALLESKHPVIVMGDMNDFNCSAPLDTLTSCGLRDSWWEGGNGYGATYHNGWLRLRIDHILHSKELKLESIKVIETDLSDHNPVVAGFSISK